MRKGILVAGSAFVDNNKFIKQYPQKGMLTKIISTEKQVGGLVSNTGIGLKKIDKGLTVSAFAGIGTDENGEYLKSILDTNGVEIDNLISIQDGITGFTDAMIVEETGERTFFSYEGANELLSKSDLKVENLDFKMVHFGYLLLMKQFDKNNEEYGTELAEVLHNIQKRGIKTSIDIVSNKISKFKKIVHPSLKYCNYVIINEVEAELITDISPYKEEEISEVKIKEIMQQIFSLGVSELVVIHAPTGGWAMTSTGEFYSQKSLSLPKGFIKSSVGAGDAFCAGALFSIYNDFDTAYMLKFANAVAAMSLSERDSVSGIGSKVEVDEFILQFDKEENNVS